MMEFLPRRSVARLFRWTIAAATIMLFWQSSHLPRKITRNAMRSVSILLIQKAPAVELSGLHTRLPGYRSSGDLPFHSPTAQSSRVLGSSGSLFTCRRAIGHDQDEVWFPSHVSDRSHFHSATC
ncbi:hypothetical protein BAUCODRAFT_547429 [Baudoinia panamericana UAMH 10762]|uniref:Uncharacterized protein n=1 Tax=Baudoinia panamericana (strain UAMH 10762) TaxID=717646 RepID=M2MD01_BAUPA|nr:uncharacterized protein BAUCODRAFT_547429 [Baudoinia panamericana UAMH 10762]EMC94406.1 hypothetical protein BAUCODRAFT_547429 [Baudoinia panamericana UAMH 10762]